MRRVIKSVKEFTNNPITLDRRAVINKIFDPKDEWFISAKIDGQTCLIASSNSKLVAISDQQTPIVLASNLIESNLVYEGEIIKQDDKYSIILHDVHDLTSTAKHNTTSYSEWIKLIEQFVAQV